VAGRTNARTEGIVARKKVVLVKTSGNVNRKRSAMAQKATVKTVMINRSKAKASGLGFSAEL
jgi:hypothetical protein